MNSQDQVEHALKDIHLYFSQCRPYEGDETQIIVDQKKFIGLLEQLNQGIYAMLEQYEQTKQSAGDIERAARREGERLITEAQHRADDVYAASLIYTNEMINQVRELMDQTNDNLYEATRGFRREIRKQRDLLRTHETQLHADLADLADTRKYLQIIEEENRKRDQKKRDLDEEREAGRQFARNLSANRHQPYRPNEKKEEEKKPSAFSMEKPEVFVNTEAEYFQRKRSFEVAAESEEKLKSGSVVPEEKSGRDVFEENEERNEAEDLYFDDPADEEEGYSEEIEIDEEALLRAVLQEENDLFPDSINVSSMIRQSPPSEQNGTEPKAETRPSRANSRRVREEEDEDISNVAGKIKDFLLGKDL